VQLYGLQSYPPQWVRRGADAVRYGLQGLIIIILLLPTVSAAIVIGRDCYTCVQQPSLLQPWDGPVPLPFQGLLADRTEPLT
jgi:hypothetical protein